MKLIDGDYTGCSILIYDEEGNHLCDTTVIYFDRKNLLIEVAEPPESLDAGDACKLFILTSPTPCEYKGRIIRVGKGKPIVMYDGKESEKREESRYIVQLPVFIENYICDDKIYPLHTPLAVEMINISKNGARLRMPNYTLSNGDRFRMCVKINDRYKNVVAEVKNMTRTETEASEYGCRFLLCSDGGICYEHKRAG